MTHFTTPPPDRDGEAAVRRAFSTHYATLHGIDPRRILLDHDPADNALTIMFTGTSIGIRIALDDPATMRRDRDGLLRLAEILLDAVAEINERLLAVTA